MGLCEFKASQGYIVRPCLKNPKGKYYCCCCCYYCYCYFETGSHKAAQAGLEPTQVMQVNLVLIILLPQPLDYQNYRSVSSYTIQYS